MRILGIDPALRITGYGVIEYGGASPRLLEAGVIKPNPKGLIQTRINRIYTLLGEVIDQYKPEVLVLEKLYAHYRHPVTASILGHVRGVICLLCAQKNVGLVEQSAKRVRKAIVGNGAASKQQTRKVVAATLNIDEKKLTLDASDALALALGYTQVIRCKI